MTITFLHHMFHNTLAKLAHLFAQHDSYRPTKEKLMNLALDCQLEIPRAPNGPQVMLSLKRAAIVLFIIL